MAPTFLCLEASMIADQLSSWFPMGGLSCPCLHSLFVCAARRSAYTSLIRKMMSTIPLTVEGAKRLEAELERLKTVERPEVINAIAEARAQGDLSENAEYDAARERQAFLEGRIRELEGTLSNAQIIDPADLQTDGRVVFGATVTLLDLETDKEVTYQIVGDVESDIRAGRISVLSPVARALIGKEEGDVTEVSTPGGVREFEIIEVRYG